MIIKHWPGRFHANSDALSRPSDKLKECLHYKPNISLKQLPCGGCEYCQRAHRNWARFLTDIDEVIPLVKPRNRQRQFKNVSSAMLQLFATTSETLAPPHALKTTEYQIVPDSPNVDCNLDLTVSAPTLEQLKEDNTWFSTHIDLICLPTTAHIIISDDNSCHVAAITQSEGISFTGFTTEEIKTKQSEDPDLLLLLNWLKNKNVIQGRQRDEKKVEEDPKLGGRWDYNNNATLQTGTLKPRLGRGTTMEGIGGTYELVLGVGFVLVEEASASSTSRSMVKKATLPTGEQAVLRPVEDILAEEVGDSAPVADPEGMYDYRCPRSGRMERTYILSQRDQHCPVRGCPVVTRSVKRHVLGEHLSYMFAPTQEPHLMRDPGFHRYRGHMVMVLAQWLTGQTSATYDDLVKFLRRHARVSVGYPQAGEEMPVFRTVCREMGWPTQAWFRIQPVREISSPVWRLALEGHVQCPPLLDAIASG
ncbi:unnamed protein product [Mytilus coruscus]|uniref:Uncharacterized protein n=1 Tax=Mytilus coruscus TaxID=42192 RepID=A0A6J8EIF5_MYTCO|nr:unnamed protein product [Mytilus coruscus]